MIWKPPASPNGITLLQWLGVLISVGLGLAGLCTLGAEDLWFTEVGYRAVFWLRLKTQVGIGAIATLVSAIVLLGNLAHAQRLTHPPVGTNPQHAIATSSRSLPFRVLLPLIVGLNLLVGLLILHYGQVVLHLFQVSLSQPDGLLPLPDRIRPERLWQLLHHLLSWQTPSSQRLLEMGGLLAVVMALFVYSRVLLSAIALILSLSLGIILSAYWGQVLQFLYAQPFHRTDPLFLQDIRAYVFALPLGQLLEFWLVGLFFYGLISVALVYLLAGDSVSQGRFGGFSQQQQRHLYGLSGCCALTLCLSYGLSCYELLYSSSGVVYGASYVDVRVRLPAYIGLSLLTGAIALSLFWQAGRKTTSGKRQRRRDSINHLLAFNGVLLTVMTILLGYFLPFAVQMLEVRPNELAREQPYIQRAIALTREAFDLEAIEVEPFDPKHTLTHTDLQANDLTIRNIRLWDTRPLLETNRQLQQIRPYYRFLDADIDRYTFQSTDLTSKASNPHRPSADKQQVLIAARELDYKSVPQEAQTWVNEHLVYTHGYGFTLSPVNKVAVGGLPDYFVKDIAISPNNGAGGLAVASDRIRDTIPIQHPRIYYGEGTNTYVMTNTRVQELDYPSGNDNVYTTYDGTGGISIGNSWRRWLFALYLHDWQMVLSNNVTPQTKLLVRRTIKERVRAIAPFLRYDQDPYLVIADAKVATHGTAAQSSPTKNYLYWILDAYTTTDHYPYSEPGQQLSTSIDQTPPIHASFNYIRNSVKVVVDAYNGTVQLYVADPDDPIIQTWVAIFPTLFQPLEAMPASLRSHIRYPVDLFRIQAERLMTYHMTDPHVFYNREDKWQVPKEIYGNKPQLVDPYYLIMKLPTGTEEEFILLLPFTPNQRTNLIAWLSARSDGTEYGKQLLYLFSKQQLVYGTEQIEARINQDPLISQQISLWNRQGSRAIQGNLLVIPIAQSLLYVEPLYLEAEQNSLPTLARVIVAYENQIVMAETLEQGLQRSFPPTPFPSKSSSPTPSSLPAIAHPVP
jgi:hypothetical protein